MAEDEARALIEDHLGRSHGGMPVDLEAFVPKAAPKKPRPPSRRSRG